MSWREHWARLQVDLVRALHTFAGTPAEETALRARARCTSWGGHFRGPTPGEITPCRACGTEQP